jgi:hypothetical protein
VSEQPTIPYTPGYALAKLGLAVLGVILIGLGLTKIGPILAMGLAGNSVMAEAVRVVLVDASDQETALATDAEVKDAERRLGENRDRSVVFYMEYRFTLPDGRRIEARSPIGQVLKPLHPFRDQDGLPATLRLWYDGAHPERIAIPFQFLPGTWQPFGFGTFFIAGMLVLFGAVAVLMGLLLWWHAGRTIRMPDLTPRDGGGAAGH